MEECSFCKEHEQNDELYQANFYEDGMDFWKLQIKYCPVCGSILQTHEERMKRFRAQTNEG